MHSLPDRRCGMKYRYVVIERQYGSGGTEIGRMLSELTGIPCYGAEILESVSKKLSIPVSDIQRYEESVTNSLLYSMYALGKMNDGSDAILTKEDRLFLEEQSVIREYAMRGKAIFIGRCAAGALEQTYVLSVFIHADYAFRKMRIMQEYGIAEKAVAGTMAKFDKKRSHYYHANTGKKWDDSGNYQIMLDSGKLGTKACAEIIKAAWTCGADPAALPE